MPDIDTTATGGVEFRTYRRGGLVTDGADQYVVPVEDKIVSFVGRHATFRIPGRAGTVGAPVSAIFNAVGSAVLVDVTSVSLDLLATVIKAVTVVPPIVRIARLTAIPTGGTAGAKVPEATAGVSNNSVTTYQDASADGTLSATALAATPAANTTITQEYTARLITAAGYEPADRIDLLTTGGVTLTAGQGLVVWLAYNTAAANPATDFWISTLRFKEYTRP